MKRPACLIAPLALSLATSGCMPILPKKAAEPENRLSEQDKRELLLAGGQELVDDAELITSKAAAGDPIMYCLGKYSFAATTEREVKGDPQSGRLRAAYGKCTKECEKAASGPYQSYATKYGARCKERGEALTKGMHLQDARTAMEALRKSDDPLAWYHRSRSVKEILDRSKQGLGAPNDDLEKMSAEYDKLVLAHKKEIDKASAFLDRADIFEMQQQAKVLDEELNVLERRYQKHHWDSTRDLIRVTKARRDALDERYQREARKAGVLKDGK